MPLNKRIPHFEVSHFVRETNFKTHFMQIKNIIFDLGGVLLDVDYDATIQAFKEQNVTDFDSFFTQAAQVKLFDRLDKGEILPQEFRDTLRQLSGVRIGDQQIDEAWNAMLGPFPEERMTLLKKVKTHYHIFLLSNTNAIHYPVYQEYMKVRFGMNGLEDLFEKQYLSYRIGMRKPDVEIFQHVVDDSGLHPGETLFIDDSLQHVQGAEKAGLHAVHLDVLNGSDIARLFNKNGLLSHPVSS